MESSPVARVWSGHHVGADFRLGHVFQAQTARRAGLTTPHVRGVAQRTAAGLVDRLGTVARDARLGMVSRCHLFDRSVVDMAQFSHMGVGCKMSTQTVTDLRMRITPLCRSSGKCGAYVNLQNE